MPPNFLAKMVARNPVGLLLFAFILEGGYFSQYLIVGLKPSESDNKTDRKAGRQDRLIVILGKSNPLL